MTLGLVLLFVGLLGALLMGARARGVAWGAVGVLALVCVAGAEPQRVLLINSFGRTYEPFDTFTENLRTELNRQSLQPVEFFEVSLESARFDGSLQEGPFVNYLLSLFSGRSLHLVVPVGGPAVQFARKYRQQLFPEVPMLLAAVDERHLQSAALTANDVVVAVRNEPTRVLETILQLLPQTTNVCIVVGNSPLEKFWRTELEREFQTFTNRLTFEWFNDLSFEEMRKRSAALPPNSAIFYNLLAVDVEGFYFAEERALAGLREVANAPIFGLHDTQLGQGIVGGPLIEVGELSRKTAEAGVRILRGESPSAIKVPTQWPGRTQFDWRELQRWGIGEKSLPAGSAVLFRQSGLWERYRWPIIGVMSVCLLQAMSILGLLLSRTKRLRAESDANQLSRRLIQAHEEERTRLARELHDDLTQRVARMAIDVGRVEGDRDPDSTKGVIRSVRDGLVGLSADIHALAYRLHPSILTDLGLGEALKNECERFSRRESITANVLIRDLPGISPDTALCLFRVTQEALRNVARHACATKVTISLGALDGGLQLVVSDNGIGMNCKAPADHPSLGLASMRERVNLVDGQFEVDSTPGKRTTIRAWVPLETTQR